MLLADAIVMILAIMVILGGGTQIVWPLLNDRPIFPMFRQRYDAEVKLAKAMEKCDEADIDILIANIERETEAKHAQTKPTEGA